ncbi:MAG: glycosyltransferase family 2 protein [Bacteroidota bacterium]
MKVCGFTFIKNAIKYDYPIVEAIQSILPICDEVVVAVGKSEDETLELIQNINASKIKIVNTVWDESLRAGGTVLAEETNKAFTNVAEDSDWCFYIQGDEVVHEKYHPEILEAMKNNLKDKNVEGLLFKYEHFYGSYDFVGDSRKWYRREVRIIRNDKRIHSWKDAQGFRKDGRKLKVKLIDAYIYHYGWVKHPKHQQLKQKSFNKLWHSDAWVAEKIPDVATFDYSQIDSLKKFEGTHPKVMQERIQKMNWEFTFDPTAKRMSLKDRALKWMEDISGWRIGEYKNYEEIL